VFSVKILVTGVSGQVGHALVSGAPAHVELVACTRADVDIADERAVLSCVRLHKPAVIVNAAAYTAVDRAETEPELARRINADGPLYLAQAAREVGARLVHISTDFVFDGTSSVPYRPDAEARPLNVYGMTKKAGEDAVLGALPEHSVILRSSWVYAAGGRNFLGTMLRHLRSTGAVRVVADQIGTPTAARSVAEAIWQIIDKPAISGIHHWTDAGVASWYDFAVAIVEEAAQLGLLSGSATVTPIATKEYPSAARRPAYSVLDKRSLISLGFIPVHWRTRLRSVLGEIRHA
jgi:dTDP-4-dehydrorhamnose reductase